MRRSLFILVAALLLVTLACGRGQGRAPESTPATLPAPLATEPQPQATPGESDAPVNTPLPAELTSAPATVAPGATATAAGIQALPSPPVPAPPVPQAFQPLFDTLQGTLTDFQSSLAARWDGQRAGAIIAGELTPATGNLGEQLLEPNNMVLLRQYLDALQAAGVTGIGMQISYPLLLPDYPRSDEYLAFYKTAADEVRRRGLTLLIESSPVFAGTQFSSVVVDYTGMTPETYFAGRRLMLVTIAREIRPDYLSITHEPDTEVALTRLRLTPDDFVRFVNDTIAEIGPNSGVLLGAGNGSWSGAEFIEAYATQTDVDFINLHVYPVVSPGPDPLASLVTAAEIAQANGKELVIGESWLYKADVSDLQRQGISLGAYYERDVFSFWQPLDIQFMETLALLGDIYDFRFINFFWTRYFFAYVDHSPANANMVSQQLFRQANRAATNALNRGSLTATGQAVTRLSGR